MYKISIGLCVKNSEATIKAAIESVVNQDFPTKYVEIIIVDGNSRDRTMDIINKTLSRTKFDVRIFSDKGKGLGPARQIVVNNARGKYIIWVDSDVVLAKDFIRRQLKFMEENSQVGIARGKGEHIKSGKNVWADVQSVLFSMLDTVHVGATIATICSTKALREVNGFDTRIIGAAEDVDLKTRVVLKDWKMATNPEAKFYHIPRRTLKDLSVEQLWYGYGYHFISHKHKGFFNIIYRLPPVYVGWGLKLSRKAFHRFREKKAFLIPLLCFFTNINWWIGFIKSHIDGYGHPLGKFNKDQ